MDISGIPQKTSLLDYLKYIVDNDTRSNLLLEPLITIMII